VEAGASKWGFHPMRLTTAALALLIETTVNDQVRAADSCRACNDYRKRCMATDIGVEACRKK
jgi:hypothetical protein